MALCRSLHRAQWLLFTAFALQTWHSPSFCRLLRHSGVFDPTAFGPCVRHGAHRRHGAEHQTQASSSVTVTFFSVRSGMEHVTPELLKWAVGAVFTVAGAIFTAVGFLLVKAYGLGKASEKVDHAIKEIGESKALIARAVERLETVAVHETRLGTLEQVYRKIHSDIRELLKATTKLETREEMRSGHDLSADAPHGEE